MADHTIDARGLSCPEPVLLARQALQGLASGTIEVLVDTTTSCENVTRMAKSLGCTVETSEGEGGTWVLSIRKA